MWDNDIKALIGATITSAQISNDRQSITLETTGGRKRLQATADCCSYTWIESVDDEEALLGKVVNIENIDMPNYGDVPSEYRESVDCVRYYGLKITTDKGQVVIDYRNDSNGYYGGDLELVEGGD